MKRQAGFSLMEVLVTTALMVIIMGTTLRALSDATHANEAVTLMADSQENLRAGMNYMTKDLIEAGEGLPQGGIPIPNSATPLNPAPALASAVNRPGPVGGPATFPPSFLTLPAITDGFQQGPQAVTPNPNVPGGVLLGTKTDFITLVYADNTIIDTVHNTTLNSLPIFLAASGGNPGCPAGSLDPTGLTATFDANCITLPTGNTAITPGDLIMFQNANGATIQTVTAVNGQKLTFTGGGGGDAFALNGTGKPSGTIANMKNPDGSFPPTTASRIWMITYYLNTANQQRPMLMRQVNFRPASPVAEVIEDLSISYDINSGPPNTNTVEPLYSPNAIRKVNLSLAARADSAYSQNKQYFRNNLQTQVSVRSLAFFNSFQ
ncbi:MAG TPA: prepilin-type N-terminal cleavage/methylation domain-containing protein [Candidatus Acidoferrales bacterium]|nr:prepilin-type N-terminal cleavage/methylation domain-containing protein [Candidatus Acidoferrales bacterium]